MRLLQPPTSTSALLEEAIGIITFPGLKCQFLGGWTDPTPIILTIVGVIHEQRSIYVGQETILDIFLNKIVQSLVKFNIGGIDLFIVDR